MILCEMTTFCCSLLEFDLIRNATILSNLQITTTNAILHKANKKIFNNFCTNKRIIFNFYTDTVT